MAKDPKLILRGLAINLARANENTDMDNIQRRLEPIQDIDEDGVSWDAFLMNSVGIKTPLSFYEWLFRVKQPIIDFSDPTGKTALMSAAELGRFDLVQFFVEKGANVNAVTNPKYFSSIGSFYFNDLARVNYPLTPIMFALLNAIDIDAGANIILFLKERGAIIDKNTRRFYNNLRENIEASEVGEDKVEDYKEIYDDLILENIPEGPDTRLYGKIYFPVSEAGKITDPVDGSTIQFTGNGEHTVVAGFNYMEPSKLDTFKAGIISSETYNRWRDNRREQGARMTHPPSTLQMSDANTRFYITNAYNPKNSNFEDFKIGKKTISMTGEDGTPYNIYFKRYAYGGKRHTRHRKTKKRTTKRSKTRKNRRN
jgi:hypothetical protein